MSVQGNFGRTFLDLKKFRMTIATIQRRMLFMVERNLSLVFSYRNDCVVNRCFIRFWFAFDMSYFFFADSGMTSGALVLSGESILAVVTCPAIPAPVKRFHDKIFLFLGKQGLHFKQAAVAFFAAYLLYVHMMLMTEDDGLHRLRIKNPAAIGKATLCSSADISDTENGEQYDQ